MKVIREIIFNYLKNKLFRRKNEYRLNIKIKLFEY